MTRAPTIEVHVTPQYLREQLLREASVGLTGPRKWVSPKWFYDDVGSALFEKITELPEYYPTRREREILLARAGEIARLSGAEHLVELGSGSSQKTRILLDAFEDLGCLTCFTPLDVNRSVVEHSVADLADEYPELELHAVVGDFTVHIDRLPRRGRRTVAFLGGTIGNLVPAQRREFFASLAEASVPGDTLLLGTDLVKDVSRLLRAYDDSAGVTAAFNLNVLDVLSRELEADFRREDFAHKVLFDRTNEWIEMRLRCLRDHTVHLGALGRDISFAEGEEILTEISAKFRPESVREELTTAGFELIMWATDPQQDFAVSLAVRR
ncbi:MAG: histidine N-alpha-methyltransferase [Acidimicrobiales bacterium]|nr:MAG: histidine N-alpha-methyltransferase [Acidimicrobiales bacterium]